ncbi:MAG: GNAT family N-acetyltransferase [Acidimicrobiales bacterium]
MSSNQAHRQPKIQMLSATMSKDQRLVADITGLVNQVYATAEAGLWVDGATRTTTVEMEQMISACQIAVAKVNRLIVGAIRIQQLDATTGEFGMLAAQPAHRGEGVGRELVRFAEHVSLQRGLANMQLELLVPRDRSHPTKEFLHAWYTRIGYQVMRTGRIDESYPHLAPLLATPCDFVVYHKPLISLARTDARRGGLRPP